MIFMVDRFKIKPSTDQPDSEAKLLGHENIVNTLNEFINDKDTIPPYQLLSMGIGEVVKLA